MWRRALGTALFVASVVCLLAVVVIMWHGSVGQEEVIATPTEPATTNSATQTPETTATQPSVTPTTSAPHPTATVPPAVPVRLVIDGPGVHIDRQFSPTPVKPQYDPKSGGTFIVPPEATQADLDHVYVQMAPHMQLPAYPVKGPVFISGHTCHLQGCSAAFDDLQQIASLKNVTAKLYFSSGQVMVYTLTQTQSIPQDKVAYSQALYDYSDPSLRIMTCKLNADHSPQDHQFVSWWKLDSVQS